VSLGRLAIAVKVCLCAIISGSSDRLAATDSTLEVK